MLQKLLWILLLSAMFCHGAVAQQPRQTIEIINIYDAFGRELPGVAHDWGFSALVRYRGKTILFDAGTSARKLEQNVKALKLDLSKVDVAILSHSHFDHLGGFDYLLEKNPKVKIYLPNDFTGLGAPSRFPFQDRESGAEKDLSNDEQYFRGAQRADGFPVEPTGRFWKNDHEYIAAAKEVLPGLRLVPTRSALTGTFNRYPPFEQNPNLNGLPELSAVFSTAEGDIVISGCSHSGIENIVRASKGEGRTGVRLVVGGFHLITYDRAQVTVIASTLRDGLKVEAVAPAHCTGHLGFSVFRRAFGPNYRFFGLGERLVLSDEVANK